MYTFAHPTYVITGTKSWLNYFTTCHGFCNRRRWTRCQSGWWRARSKLFHGPTSARHLCNHTPPLPAVVDLVQPTVIVRQNATRPTCAASTVASTPACELQNHLQVTLFYTQLSHSKHMISLSSLYLALVIQSKGICFWTEGLQTIKEHNSHWFPCVTRHSLVHK